MNRKGASITLTGMVIVGTLAVSVLAGWISFFTLRDLAVFLGWPRDTASFLMPLVEVFLLIGSAELALRVRDDDPHTAGPRVLAWSALVVTLAGNIGDHVLRALGAVDQAQQWRLVVLGAVAAIPPLAQMGTLHMLTGRLLRIAQARAAARTDTAPAGPSIAGSLLALARQRVADAVASKMPTAPVSEPEQVSVPAVEPARPAKSTTTARRTAPAQRKGKGATGTRPAWAPKAGSKAGDGFDEWYQAQRDGVDLSAAEVAQRSGMAASNARTYLPQWKAALAAEQASVGDAEAVAALTGGSDAEA